MLGWSNLCPRSGRILRKGGLVRLVEAGVLSQQFFLSDLAFAFAPQTWFNFLADVLGVGVAAAESRCAGAGLIETGVES